MKSAKDVMNNINTSELDNFLINTDSNFIALYDIKETKVDNSWLNVLEDTLPNIDKIVRNPRRFLVQEEDVVIVEKIKRVSQETIKHLAQHSENIQDIDINDEVVPKKLLNVHKEDTADLYENRFIYTLVKRLEEFINRQLENLDMVSKKEVEKKVRYKANTILDDRKINIELKMEEYDNYENDDDSLSIKNRILSCYEIISSFRTTEMIKELVGCSLVKNPIRKTNLILRQPDFQKAYILWQYLDNFEFKDPKVVNYEKKTDTSKETKDEFTLSYYIAANAIDENKDNLMQYKNIDMKLNKLISDFIYEDNHNIDEFVIKTKDMYSNAIKDKEKRINEITNIYNNFINSHNDIIKDIESVI